MICHHHHQQVLLLVVEHGIHEELPSVAISSCPPWPHSVIFLYFLFHPLLFFAMFSLAYLFFCTPEDSILMQFSLLLLFLDVMCVQSNSIFFFKSEFLLVLCLIIHHSSSFEISSVYFIFIIRLKYSFINVWYLVISLVVFHVLQVYNNTDFTFVLNLCKHLSWSA
jgi:hypothetical protein